MAPTPGLPAVDGGLSLDVATQAPSREPGVAVLPAGDPTSGAPSLDGLTRWDGPVLLDCPPGAGPDAAAPIRAADRALVVTTPDRPSLADAATTGAMCRALGTPVAATVLRQSDSAGGGRASPAAERVAGLVGAPVRARLPAVPPPAWTHEAVREALAPLVAPSGGSAGRHPAGHREG